MNEGSLAALCKAVATIDKQAEPSDSLRKKALQNEILKVDTMAEFKPHDKILGESSESSPISPVSLKKLNLTEGESSENKRFKTENFDGNRLFRQTPPPPPPPSSSTMAPSYPLNNSSPLNSHHPLSIHPMSHPLSLIQLGNHGPPSPGSHLFAYSSPQSSPPSSPRGGAGNIVRVQISKNYTSASDAVQEHFSRSLNGELPSKFSSSSSSSPPPPTLLAPMRNPSNLTQIRSTSTSPSPHRIESIINHPNERKVGSTEDDTEEEEGEETTAIETEEAEGEDEDEDEDEEMGEVEGDVDEAEMSASNIDNNEKKQDQMAATQTKEKRAKGSKEKEEFEKGQETTGS